MKRRDEIVNALKCLGYELVEKTYTTTIQKTKAKKKVTVDIWNTFKCKHVEDTFIYVHKNGTVRFGKNPYNSMKVGQVNVDAIISEARSRRVE